MTGISDNKKQIKIIKEFYGCPRVSIARTFKIIAQYQILK